MCDEDKGPYVDWMYDYFGDCIHDFQDAVSFALGMVSLVCWVIVAWPQMYETYQKKSGDSISVSFLLLWGVGDAANIAGCILTDQLPTQLYVAIWYAISIVILLAQIYYYRWRRNRSLWASPGAPAAGDDDPTKPLVKPPPTPQIAYGVLALMGVACVLGPVAQLGGRAAAAGPGGRVVVAAAPAARSLLSGGGGAGNTVGVVLGWVSSALYTLSRLPQIIKNRERKSVEGLSLSMFGFAVLGNITYAASIFVRSVESDFLYDSAPWIVGSLGTLVFDMTIFLQFSYYKRLAKSPTLHIQDGEVYGKLVDPLGENEDEVIPA